MHDYVYEGTYIMTRNKYLYANDKMSSLNGS